MKKERVYLVVSLFTLLTATFLSQSETKAPGVKRLQPWAKKGQILAPGFAGTLSSNLLSAPSVVRLKNGRLRMYFWTREGRGEAHTQEGRSLLNYIYAAEASIDNLLEWKLVKSEPMLKPSSTGNISDRGPSFPFVIQRRDGTWLMYYAVWGSWAPPGELSNRTSLAISDDEGLTWKVLKEPLLPLGAPGECDAGLTGSVCVLQTGPKKYDMWYTAGERYEMIGPIKRGIVHIGYATSEDGIHWVKNKANSPALSPRLNKVKPFEAVVSKPCVLRIGNAYHMWFSVFSMEGRGYRLNYARSKDGLRWQRFADDEVLPLTPEGFDSKNQSYPNVIEVGDELWMFYAGDNFGSTGIGLATLKKSELK